jgi:hypothetical protein
MGLGPGDAGRTDGELSQWNYHTRLMYRNQLCLTTLIMKDLYRSGPGPHRPARGPLRSPTVDYTGSTVTVVGSAPPRRLRVLSHYHDASDWQGQQTPCGQKNAVLNSLQLRWRAGGVTAV